VSLPAPRGEMDWRDAKRFALSDLSFVGSNYSFLGPPERMHRRAHMVGMPMGPIDDLRFFVWRSGDWHPVSKAVEHQIKMNLFQNTRVFDVLQGSRKWSVDTTSDDGWVMVNADGKRRAMKYQETLDTSGPQATPSSGGKAKPGRTPRSMDFYNGSLPLIDALRTEWSFVSGGRDVTITKDELISACKTSSAHMEEQDMGVIIQSAADTFKKADLNRDGRLELDEWLHYRLLENQAPSFYALAQVNERLIQWLKQQPGILSRVLRLFEACLSEQSAQDARITGAQLIDAARKWLDSLSLGDYKLPGMKSAREQLERLTKSEKVSLDEPVGEAVDDCASYYDFLNYVLGRGKAEVQLYQYDLSNGKAWWISPLVFCGQQFEGIWHTGVVVHGREYWFGGGVFESTPGDTPFGQPTKVVPLPAQTMRTRDELWSFVQQELSGEFTRGNYDVLTHNCNHFTDALCLFLINQHIPKDVLQQPQQVMNTCVARLLRPVLNRMLGRFRAEGTSETEGGVVIADRSADEGEVEETWSALETGSLVVYDYEEGWTCIARVVAKHETDCDLRWLDVRSGAVRVKRGVDRHFVRPLPKEVDRSPGRSPQSGVSKLFCSCYHP